ncbi:MAG: hypothetical protein GX331_04315 [Firmicutes bacterium]|nr:hypothetical protein [Bacillota bacterium]
MQKKRDKLQSGSIDMVHFAERGNLALDSDRDAWYINHCPLQDAPKQALHGGLMNLEN